MGGGRLAEVRELRFGQVAGEPLHAVLRAHGALRGGEVADGRAFGDEALQPLGGAGVAGQDGLLRLARPAGGLEIVGRFLQGLFGDGEHRDRLGEGDVADGEAVDRLLGFVLGENADNLPVGGLGDEAGGGEEEAHFEAGGL